MTKFARFTKSTVVLAGVMLMSACSTNVPETINPFANDGPSKASQKLNSRLGVHVGQNSDGALDPIAKAAFWGTRYDRSPGKADVAVNFSQSLRGIQSNQEALHVMEQAYQRHPDNADVSLEYGKVLIASDRAYEAVRPIEKAIAASKKRDWRTYSAYGVALDKIGEHAAAQEQYNAALRIKPNNPTVLNNKGLSHALDGDLKLAEQTLRLASRNNGGTAQMRQNLAIVLGFGGKTSEAERLARSDLPPRLADNNTDYFRSLFAQPAYWQDFDAANVDIPTFQSPTTAPVETAPFETYQSAPTQEPVPLYEPEPAQEETPSGSVLSVNDRSFISQPIAGYGVATTIKTDAYGQPISVETTSADGDTRY